MKNPKLLIAAGVLIVAAIIVSVVVMNTKADPQVPPNQVAPQTPDNSQSAQPGMSEYNGLSEAAAASKAESAGLDYRVVRRDSESFPATSDYLESRVNFEIDNGKVTKAYKG